MSFRLVDEAKKEFPVRRLCRALGVSQSGYFGAVWQSSPTKRGGRGGGASVPIDSRLAAATVLHRQQRRPRRQHVEAFESDAFGDDAHRLDRQALEQPDDAHLLVVQFGGTPERQDGGVAGQQTRKPLYGHAAPSISAARTRTRSASKRPPSPLLAPRRRARRGHMLCYRNISFNALPQSPTRHARDRSAPWARKWRWTTSAPADRPEMPFTGAARPGSAGAAPLSAARPASLSWLRRFVRSWPAWRERRIRRKGYRGRRARPKAPIRRRPLRP